MRARERAEAAAHAAEQRRARVRDYESRAFGRVVDLEDLLVADSSDRAVVGVGHAAQKTRRPLVKSTHVRAKKRKPLYGVGGGGAGR